MRRERKIRRRALAISITLQAIALAVILACAAAGQAGGYFSRNVMPLPPYYSLGRCGRGDAGAAAATPFGIAIDRSFAADAHSQAYH